MAHFPIEDCSSRQSPGRLIRRLAKIMTAHIESRLEGRDLSFVQWVALKSVRDGAVSNAGDLARELGITTGATTRLIDGLEERALLLRDRTHADRRVVRIGITDAGREAVAALLPEVSAAINALVADLDQSEADALVQTLSKLLAKAEQLSCPEKGQ